MRAHDDTANGRLHWTIGQTMAAAVPEPPDRDIFVEVAKLLYGREWQDPTASDLGVDPGTIRAWDRREAPIPARFRKRLRRLLAERIAALTEAGGGR